MRLTALLFLVVFSTNLKADEGFIRNIVTDFHSYRVEDKNYLEKVHMTPDADEYQSYFVCGKKVDKLPKLNTASEKKDFYEEYAAHSTKCKVEMVKKIKAAGCKINEMTEVPSRNQPEENYGHYRTFIFNSDNCTIKLKSGEECPSGTEAKNLSMFHKVCLKSQPTSGFQKASHKTN